MQGSARRGAAGVVTSGRKNAPPRGNGRPEPLALWVSSVHKEWMKAALKQCADRRKEALRSVGAARSAGPGRASVRAT